CLPTLGAEENPVPPGGAGYVVDVELRPFELGAQRRERLRRETFVDFDDVEDGVARIDPLEISDNLADGRLRPAEVKSGRSAKCVRPRRRQKRDDPMGR